MDGRITPENESVKSKSPLKPGGFRGLSLNRSGETRIIYSRNFFTPFYQSFQPFLHHLLIIVSGFFRDVPRLIISVQQPGRVGNILLAKFGINVVGCADIRVPHQGLG